MFWLSEEMEPVLCHAQSIQAIVGFWDPTHEGPYFRFLNSPLFIFRVLSILRKRLLRMSSMACCSANWAHSSFPMKPIMTSFLARHSPSWDDRYMEYLPRTNQDS